MFCVCIYPGTLLCTCSYRFKCCVALLDAGIVRLAGVHLGNRRGYLSCGWKIPPPDYARSFMQGNLGMGSAKCLRMFAQPDLGYTVLSSYHAPLSNIAPIRTHPHVLTAALCTCAGKPQRQSLLSLQPSNPKSRVSPCTCTCTASSHSLTQCSMPIRLSITVSKR